MAEPPQANGEHAEQQAAAAAASDAASSKGNLERAGHVLFRFRSLTPLPLLAVALPLLWQGRGSVAPLWLVSGLLLCLAGQTLRAWVLGQVRDGTSGQNEKLIAVALNTHGPYAHARNPLYLGNLGITLGLCVIAHEPIVLALAAALFFLQYRAIIAVEEAFLGARFGAAYAAYVAKVPRFWPRLHATPSAAQEAAAEPEGRPSFSWARVLRKEHNPLAAWLLLALLLTGLDRGLPLWRAGARLSLGALGLWQHALGSTLVVALWLAAKAWKHQWLSGGFAADLRRRLGR